MESQGNKKKVIRHIQNGTYKGSKLDEDRSPEEYIHKQIASITSGKLHMHAGNVNDQVKITCSNRTRLDTELF